jgi:hypothetical protein
MTTARDDAERLRIRDAYFGVEVSQSGRDQWQGMPCLLARTTTIKSYPSLAQSFYACSPVTILGAEVEGGAGSLTAGTSTFLALNVGSAIPPSGANILVTFVDNRWVFRYDG